MGNPAREPYRRCAACRARRPKAALLRFARVARPGGSGVGEGWSIEFDPYQRAEGRGAYTCRDEGCLQRGFQKGGVARTLRISLRQDEGERLSTKAVEYLRGHAMPGALPPVQRSTGTPLSGTSPGEES